MRWPHFHEKDFVQLRVFSRRSKCMRMCDSVWKKGCEHVVSKVAQSICDLSFRLAVSRCPEVRLWRLVQLKTTPVDATSKIQHARLRTLWSMRSPEITPPVRQNILEKAPEGPAGQLGYDFGSFTLHTDTHPITAFECYENFVVYVGSRRGGDQDQNLVLSFLTHAHTWGGRRATGTMVWPPHSLDRRSVYLQRADLDTLVCDRHRKARWLGNDGSANKYVSRFGRFRAATAGHSLSHDTPRIRRPFRC